MTKTRSGGGGGQNTDPSRVDWERHETEIGYVYFTSASDPGYGYIIEGDNEGFPTGGAPNILRYPLSYILWVLGGDTPIPSGAQTQKVHAPQEVREASGIAPGGKILVPYGEVRVGGAIIFGPRINPLPGFRGYWYVGYGLGQGECDSLVKFELEPGKLATAAPTSSYVSFNFHPGVQSPATANDPDPLLQQGTYGAGPGGGYEALADMELFPNRCYVGVRFKFNAAVLPRYYERPLFTIRGRKLYDPRTGLTVWSDNPALVIADYIVSKRYGMKRTVIWDSVAEAANYCDVLVAGEKRHTLNIALLRGASHKANLAMLRAHFRAMIVERDGSLAITCDKVKSSTFTFDGANSRPVRVRRKGTSEVPNRVIVHYFDKSRDWVAAEEPAQTAAVDAGTEEPRELHMQLDGCDNAAEARRQAFYILNKKLADLEVTWDGAHATSTGVEPLDRVTYSTDSLGLVSQALSVETVQASPDGHQRFVGAMYNAAIFADLTAVIETLPSTSLPLANADLPAPTSINLVETIDQVQPTVFYPRLDITFVPVDDNFYGGTMLTYTVGAGPELTIGTFMDSGTPIPITIPDGWGKAVTVKGYTVNRNTGLRGTLFQSALANLTNPAAAEAPNEFLGDIVSGFYMDPPPVRSAVTFAAGAWSGTNMTTLTGANVQDGNEATTAVVFGDATVTRSLVLDCGVATALREFELVFASSVDEAAALGAVAGDLFFQRPRLYRATAPGGPWTLAEHTGPTDPLSFGPTDRTYKRFVYTVPASVGAVRYWKLEAAADLAYPAGLPQPIAEIRTRTYGAAQSFVVGYLLSHLVEVTEGDTFRFAQRRVNFQPVTGQRITKADLEILVRYPDRLHAGYSAGTFRQTAIVQTINAKGELSAGRYLHGSVSYAAAPANSVGIPQDWQPVSVLETTVAAATTNDLHIDNLCSVLRIAASTAGAKTITGLDLGYSGRFLAIENSSTNGAVLTFTHQAAGSAAANRFHFDDGLARVLQPGQRILVYYDGAAGVAFWKNFGREAGVNSTNAINPNTAGTVFGYATATAAAKGAIVSQATFGTSSTVVLNITGRGFLKFLSLGHSAAGGDVTVTVTVDGVTLINAQNYLNIGPMDMSVAIVGGITQAFDGTNYHASAVPSDDGIPFASSLVVTVLASAVTGYVKYQYVTFA